MSEGKPGFLYCVSKYVKTSPFGQVMAIYRYHMIYMAIYGYLYDIYIPYPHG